ncbi:hypothetical protein GGX14DRAFT_569606 [Mycena pura]|uniref:KOW domain-containing protein n=1 Tax=Mycena pura TaxID=153505 RepID=A0AAD6VAY5_9AGAR|nr:hypothetical protein GGX14DRAFT_569606 [Mycena pura]
MSTTATDVDELFKSSTHGLMVDLDHDHYRPCTPPASRSPSPPPHKRQRLSKRSKIPKGVLRLLDLEARDDSDTEDDAEDVQDVAGDFIDDEPNHELPVPYEPPFRAGDQEAGREDVEILRRLAASFEERSLEERDEERRGEERREREMVEDIPHVPPNIAASLHTFYISSHWEHRLVDFMVTLDGIALVGTPGPSSRTVFFETSRLAEVANAAREWMRAHRVWFRGPQEVSLFEIAPLLNIPQSLAPSLPVFRSDNCFGRLKSATMCGLYQNDLVFIDRTGYGRIWVVPRLRDVPLALPNQPLPSAAVDQSTRPRPPRRLLDVVKLRRECPAEDLFFTSGGTRCVWGSRLFGLPCGLEILPLALECDSIRVRPTEDELELFMASDCQEIDAPYVGPSCALQEGDRVVVVDELRRYTRDGGRIVAIFERWVGNERVRMAVISRPDDLSEFAPRCFVQPVSSLRLHILSWRRAVSVGDRVVVVAGSGFRGYSGRIFDFPTPATVRFESLEPETLEVDIALRHVRLDFRRGDVVRVVRGEHKDKIGLVVALHLAGDVEFYVCDSARIRSCLRPSFTPAGAKISPLDRQTCADTGYDLGADVLATIRVPTHDVAFVPLDNSGFQLPGLSSEWAHGSVQARRGAAMALDHVRHKWELDLMRTGRFVVGMFVRVIGKHEKKGQFGVIQDYRRIVPAQDGDGLLTRDAEWGDIRKDVRISVRMDGSYLVEDLSLDNVVERDSGLAVLMALLLHEFRNVRPFEREIQELREPSPPALQLSDLTEAEVRALSGPSESLTVPRPDVGEATGIWLTHSKLVWKRIDVQVESLNFLYALAKQPNVGNKVGPKVTKVAGLRGYLRPFGRPVPAHATGSFTLRFLAQGRDANVPVVALRPLRTTPVPGEVGAFSCISARRCRVVIIGPDVSGDCTRIGDYAETIPSSPPSSTDVVEVRFAWERLSDGSHHQAHAVYHVECLCHSLNQDTPADGPPVARTDFDVKPLSIGVWPPGIFS